MGIRFSCPNGHKLNVKTFLAGKRGVCPQCGAKFEIPVLGEAQNSEPSHLSMGQSITVDTISPGQSSSTVVSPSVVVELVDTAPMPDLPVANAIPTSAERSIPVVVPPASPVVTDPAAESAKRRARRRRNQLIVSVVLLTVVLVLAVVLIWVLKRG